MYRPLRGLRYHFELKPKLKSETDIEEDYGTQVGERAAESERQALFVGWLVA